MNGALVRAGTPPQCARTSEGQMICGDFPASTTARLMLVLAVSAPIPPPDAEELER
jgi:hypothetical protein